MSKSLRSKFIDFLIATKTISIYQFFTKAYKRATIHIKVQKYIESLPPEEDLKVLFGAHWSNNPGWLLLKESDQDITKNLNFPDTSVDAIFTEHVIEHLDFQDAIKFMKESLRVLKKNGVFRVVCPMLEVVQASDLSGENGECEVNRILVNYGTENTTLQNLGLAGVKEFPRIFLFNDVFMQHGHKFIWTGDLMVQVLQAVGFSKVEIRAIGEGVNPDYCIERRCRSVYNGSNWQEDRAMGFVYDATSLVVEAIK